MDYSNIVKEETAKKLHTIASYIRCQPIEKLQQSHPAENHYYLFFLLFFFLIFVP